MHGRSCHYLKTLSVNKEKLKTCIHRKNPYGICYPECPGIEKSIVEENCKRNFLTYIRACTGSE